MASSPPSNPANQSSTNKARSQLKSVGVENQKQLKAPTSIMGISKEYHHLSYIPFISPFETWICILEIHPFKIKHHIPKKQVPIPIQTEFLGNVFILRSAGNSRCGTYMDVQSQGGTKALAPGALRAHLLVKFW